jgi:polyhydroxybutyrate depolymerase
MRPIIPILLFLLLPVFGFCQQTIQGTIQHDGLEREYQIYVPDVYTGDEPVPLVLNFHGFGSNAGQQEFYGDFRAIADTANFLIVHPEGTVFNGSQHWNVGGFTSGSTIDDVGFTDALLDTLAANYNIDPNRIYSTGMSNGGYMSFLLACQLGDRIAAIASVTGSMTPETYDDCTPTHPTPVLQIHGTDDPVVPYDGADFSKSIEEVLSYWVDYNNCSPTAGVIDVPNSNPGDGSTVEHYVYSGGTNDVTVEHFKVENGAHTWPGTIIPFPGTNYDIDASLEIWRFFLRYSLDELMTPSSQANLAHKATIQVYPNPTTDQLFITLEATPQPFYLSNATGQILQSGILRDATTTLSLAGLPTGMYWLRTGETIHKILKQ